MEDTGLEPLTSCMPWTKANRLSATKPTSNAYLTKSPSICKITHVSAKVCKECVYFRVQVCSKCVVVIVSVRWSPDGQNLCARHRFGERRYSRSMGAWTARHRVSRCESRTVLAITARFSHYT